MSEIKMINGKVSIVPQPHILTNLKNGIADDDAVNMAQYNTMAPTKSISAGTVFLAPIGSAAVPTYSFATYQTMGMYASSGTELAWATAGVFRGRISSAGLEIAAPGINNSAIGTNTPSTGAFTTVTRRPSGTTVVANTGTTLTAAMMLSGYVEVTGTTGSLALDTVANITTALGHTPTPGESFEFTLNTKGATPMTATNVVTLTAPASCIFMKQFNTTDVGSAFIPTVTATDGIHIGTFRVTFQTATSMIVQRIG